MTDPWLRRAQTLPRDPAAGSSLLGDDNATAPYHISHAVISALVSAVDHLDGLRQLITRAQVIHGRVPFTLLRAALENASIAVWLLAPQSRNERVFRRLRLQWADFSDGENARALTDVPANKSLEERKQKLQDLARARGLEQERIAQIAARPVAWSTIVGLAAEEGTPLDRNDATLIWMLCSGIAHGRTWAALNLLDREEVSRAAERVLHVKLTASEKNILVIAQCTAAMIQAGWSLLDQRSLAP
ncbi:hypothetical protein [Fodinicola acaciae]|uniref:hypothetical protein n=1 Tax=Fodinicola acaciae TaxID=2681555 RepID=UPI0013D3E0B2|nr:hypothetical protein [Fodinicola acaciae]